MEKHKIGSTVSVLQTQLLEHYNNVFREIINLSLFFS